MKQRFLFPGSFCPPTYGHLEVLKRAAMFLPHVTIVCSRNPEKEYMFTQDECAAMWLSYDLPENVNVTTLDELKVGGFNPEGVMMVRGIRDEKDFLVEAEVMKLNVEKMGLRNYMYLVTDPRFRTLSSTKAREAAMTMDLERLADYVSPMVVTKLLEKVLGVKNVFMVVGKPGCGKSTLLNTITRMDNANVHINTDEFNHLLKDVVEKAFPGEDLVELALGRPEALDRVLAKPWLIMLSQELRKVSKDSNVFVEVPYGMCSDKRIFRFIGGKVIYVGCGDQELFERNMNRGTLKYVPFIEKIPGLEETRRVAKKEKLELWEVDTSGSQEMMVEAAIELAGRLEVRANGRRVVLESCTGASSR